ncbi:MAG: hypothetical protein IT306_14605 [Chloroflexi bacterium]|nr:hypothetical protein [Chloroflexota bacterium]
MVKTVTARIGVDARPNLRFRHRLVTVRAGVCGQLGEVSAGTRADLLGLDLGLLVSEKLGLLAPRAAGPVSEAREPIPAGAHIANVSVRDACVALIVDNPVEVDALVPQLDPERSAPVLLFLRCHGRPPTYRETRKPASITVMPTP